MTLNGLGGLRGVPRSPSLATVAEERIRQELLDADGADLLTEVEIARRFGMSRTPVREALHQLVILGAIEASPAGGYVKRQYSPRDVRDHYALRIVLEEEACALAAARFVDAPTAPTVGMDRAGEDGPDGEAGDPNAGFHRRIGELSGNAVLARVIALLNERALSLVLYAHASGFDRERLDVGHGLVMAAIERGDVAGARREMRVHLEAVRDAILARMTTPGSDPR